MRVLGILLRWRLRLAAAHLRERDWARRGVAAAFVVVFAAVAFGEYEFFARSFRALAALGVAGPPLTLYALEAFFALILAVGVLSAVATGSALFFRLAENRLLLAAPVPLRALFALRGLETFLLTSWAFGLLTAPALVALGVSFHRAPGFYLIGALLLGGFLVLAGGLGTLVTMTLAVVLGHLRTRAAILGLTLLGLGLAAALVGRTVIPTRADLLAMFEPGTLNGTTVALHFVEDKFARWPSHAYAASLFGLATGQGSHPVQAFAWSLLLPLLIAPGAYGIGAILYRRVVWGAMEGTLAARAAEAPGPRRGFLGLPVVLRGPAGALLERDLLTLWRTPQELGRGAFVAFLLLLYTAFFFRVPTPGEAGTEDLGARLAAFSLLAAGYFLTTLALRFVYPAFSLEGRAAWILLASPVRPERLVWARLGFWSLAGFLALGGISLAGGARLGLTGPALAWLAGLLALLALTIMAVALGLGACWPDFRGRSAEALGTSGGGLLTLLICLAYVAVTAWLGYRVVLLSLTGGPGLSVAGPLIAAAVLSAAIVLPTLGAARRRIARLEAS